MSKSQKYSCNPIHWVDNYSEEFFRFTVFRVKNHEIAEDLVQDTFLSGLKAQNNFRGDCSEKSWLYNILRNKIIDHYRKKTNQEVKQSSLAEDQENEDSFFSRFFRSGTPFKDHWKTEAAPQEWDIAPDSFLEKEEFMQVLQFCLSLLPAQWATVFSLKNIEEYSTKEICKELDITASNLWTIIHRAKLQLRGCMEKKWLE